MVPNPNKTCLGLEYFCGEGDNLLLMSNSHLINLATSELKGLGLAEVSSVEDGAVLRQLKAYPIYNRNCKKHLDTIRNFLYTLENLQTIGRNGMHRYNNQDHSMLTGILAVKNILGRKYDLWNVNTERSYYEEFTKEEWQSEGREVADIKTVNL